MKSRLLALAAVLSLAACGGGSSSGGSIPAGTQSPVPSPTASAPSNTPQYAKMTLTWTVAPSTSTASSAHQQYVSPNATQIEVKVNSVNSAAPPSWVPADTTTPLAFGTGQNCTLSSGTATCTIQVAAPPGQVNYSFSVLDISNNVLATFTADFTIAQGTNNTLSVTLGGVVKTVTVTGPTLTANSALTASTLVVSAHDASGAQIVGSASYSTPFTVSLSDPTGSTKLHLNGGAAATSVTVKAPGDAVTIDYSGLATNNVAIVASGTGVTGGGTLTSSVQDVTFTGTTLDDATHGGLNTDSNWGQQTLFFSAPSGTQNITGAEAGFTNASFGGQFNIALDSASCTGVASASPNPGPQTTFTITAQGVGVCKAKLSESGTGYPITQHAANSAGSATHDGTFWISVTSSSFSVNTRQKH